MAAEVTRTIAQWTGGRWRSIRPTDSVDGVGEQLEPDGAHTVFGVRLRPLHYYLIFAVLAAAALILRLYGLGEMAVHHDESLHGFHAWLISIGEPHRHSPLMHGMFLFEIVAGSFFLFGDNEFTMRLPMVLFGTVLVLVPLLLRRHIGNTGALLTAVLLALSPAIFYYGRFARNDIFMAVFALLIVVSMFKYMDTRRQVWLFVLAGVFALATSTKETAYIMAVIFGGYLAILSWRQIYEFAMGRRKLSELSPSGDLLVVIVGLMMPFFAAGVSIIQPLLDLTIAAPDQTPGVPTGAPDGTFATLIALVVTLVFAGAAWGLGLAWNWRRFIGPLVLFWVVYVLVITDFGTSPSGIATGVWQSMGYWIAQQDVRRGSQPWYYYIIMMSVYEFLPLLTGMVVVAYYAVKSGIKSLGPLVIGVASLLIAVGIFYTSSEGGSGEPIASAWTVAPFLLVGVGILLWVPFTLDAPKFTKFLMVWSIATFAIYTTAGEKMPWLVVNVTLPWVVLAGVGIGAMVDSMDWRSIWHRRGWLVLALTPLYLVVAWRLINFNLSANFNFSRWSDIAQFVELWILFAIVLSGPMALWRFGNRIGRNLTLSLVALGIVAVLLGFTVKTSFVAVFTNSDVPHEMLVYTQTSPDLHLTAREISQARDLMWSKRLDYERDRVFGIANSGGQENQLPPFRVHIDSTSPGDWPWRWYLRGYGEGASYGEDGDYVRYGKLSGDEPVFDEDATVLLVSDDNNSKIKPLLPEKFGEGRYLIHRWWFPEAGYRGVTPGDIWEVLIDRSKWRTVLDFWFHRKMPRPIGYSDAWVYFSDEIPEGPLR